MNGDTPPQPGPQQPETPWQYKPEATQPTPPATVPGVAGPPATPDDDAAPNFPATPEVTWTASEFIEHSKTANWYLTLGGITLALVIALYFFTHDFVSIVGVITMAILFGIVASRKPRVLEYHLDGAGLTIGQAFHPYSEFKSFAILDDGAVSSIMLMPLKRFMPPISVYYSVDDQDSITAVIAQYLPMEMREHDAVDRFSRRIRF